MNLAGNAANWFRCTGVDPAMITWQQLVKCVLRFVLLILHNGPGTGSNSACKWVAWRLTPPLSILGCLNVLTLTIVKLSDVLLVG